MLFNHPSFLGQKEQEPSERLYNNIRITIQTHAGEIWYDLGFGTTIRDKIKQGIDNIVIVEIQDELEEILEKYFSDDVEIIKLEVWQEIDKLLVNLTYLELRTGIQNTIKSEEIIFNENQTLY